MQVGIDFGITTCSVAVIDGESPRIIPNRFGSAVTPSVVGFDPERGILVGEEAARLRVLAHGRTVSGIKRRFGSAFPVSLGPRVYTPRQVGAMIIRQLLKDAAVFLGQPVDEAVIAVPANCSEPQRQETVAAGRLAGLKRVRLVSEPTAAALAWGDGIAGRTAVFDFGGGTLDVSLLEITADETRVRCVGGDPGLGGLDFTRQLYSHLQSQSRPPAGVSRELWEAQLLELAERSKLELSSRRECEVAVPGAPLTLSRVSFEKIASPLIERAETVLRDTLAQAGWSPDSVETLIFAGGSSRIPAVRRRIEGLLPRCAARRNSPEEVVALGAARATLAGEGGGTSLFEIIPFELGIEIDGGRMLRLIDRHTPLPVKVRREFTTIADGQRSVEIHVLQGGYLKAERNGSLGRFMLNGIPAAPRGEPKIEVEFALDTDGLLSVSAKDLKSGIAERIIIPRLKPAESGTKAGGQRLRQLIAQVERESGKHRFLIDADLKADIDDILAIAAKAVGGGDAERRRECLVALQTIMEEIRALTLREEADCAG